MLIGIDASRAFTDKRTGTENYTWQLLLALAKLECEHEFRLYVRNPTGSASPSAQVSRSTSFTNSSKLANSYVETWDIPGHRLRQMSIREIPWSRSWTQGGLALETWRNPVDTLFIPAHVIPFFKNPRVPTVVTVHDLGFEFLPWYQNPTQRFYLSKIVEKLRARLATHIIAVSKATKKDLIEKLQVPEEKITVVYEGVDSSRFAAELKTHPSFAKATEGAPRSLDEGGQNSKLKTVKEKYKIEGDYILFVGTIQPRKNIVRLIEAFAQIATGDTRHAICDTRYAISNMQLVLVGKRGWSADEIYQAPKHFGVSDRVKFLDYVVDCDLPALYAGASCFCLPSLHEGFGLPVLEAMASGIPVVISNVSSLPEVGGDAAIYVNPYDVDSIAEGLRQVLIAHFIYTTLYKQLVEKGLRQVQKFSWEKCAKETIQVLEKVISKK